MSLPYSQAQFTLRYGLLRGLSENDSIIVLSFSDSPRRCPYLLFHGTVTTSLPAVDRPKTNAARWSQKFALLRKIVVRMAILDLAVGVALQAVKGGPMCPLTTVNCLMFSLFLNDCRGKIRKLKM